jgi:uncharacterized protein
VSFRQHLKPPSRRWCESKLTNRSGSGRRARVCGYLGGTRLYDSQGLNHLIYQFDSPSHLRAWKQSTQHRELLEEGDRYSDEQHTTTDQRHAWFHVPGRTAPPKWKNFLLTWAAVYPTLLLVSTALTKFVPALPRPLSLAITSGVLTAVLTWVILPIVTRRARRWLLRGAGPDRA